MKKIFARRYFSIKLHVVRYDFSTCLGIGCLIEPLFSSSGRGYLLRVNFTIEKQAAAAAAPGPQESQDGTSTTV